MRSIKLSLFICGITLFACVAPKNPDRQEISSSFTNPVLAGDYPDPSVVRVGKDFYMTHSSFEYYPGLLVWHSTDLINWKRIGHALHSYVGSVWAPDMIFHNNMFYIYFPAGGTNWVVTALKPEGPWTDPVDLKLSGSIDPGHVVDNNGIRYLYLSDGKLVQLSDDGLSTVGEVKHIYDGWQFPKEWSTECFCLESPKSTIKDGHFYLISAQGGTAGPSTSHMVVAARASSPIGPWENSPNNPIVHTQSRNERWWSQGHGTLVDDVEGNYWIMYHGYEKKFHTLGRQTLMLPVEWTNDHWFRVPEGITSENDIKKPAGEASAKEIGLSDNFDSGKLELQWQFFKKFNPDRLSFADGKMRLSAEGSTFEETTPLLVNTSDRSYETIVTYAIDEKTTAGLTLYYNEKANVRIAVDSEKFSVFVQQRRKISVPNTIGSNGYLRILNEANEVSFYYSADGTDWQRLERSLDATGYNHNVFGEFMSLRIGVFAHGEGYVWFDDFMYKASNLHTVGR